MNRVIKFRVWDGHFMRYWYDGFSESTDVLVEVFEHFDQYKYETMQFTGLKDRNNQDIYEGDIIGSHASEKPCNYIVKWGETRSDYCGFVLNPVFINPPKFTHIIHNFKIWMSKDFEVLGNIFQNPELLA